LGVVKQFLNHIHRHKLCKTSDKILLAVSGGLDSMVMLDLFREAGFNIAVAHCNFQLRGKESLGDENLVRQTAESCNLKFHVNRFDTLRETEEQKLSIQVAARELRYKFFNEIAEEFNYQCIATAHHIDDELETLLINLVRGTGALGLTGIPLKNGKIIRPLLFTGREDLKEYAIEKKLVWREDASNASDDYQRNFLRHQVIPQLRQINPNLEETFIDTMQRLKGMREVMVKAVDHLKGEIFSEHSGDIHINIEKIQSHLYPAVILWELIKDFGFNYDQCKQIVENHQSGKQFSAGDVMLTVDREYYILQRGERQTWNPIDIEQGQQEVFANDKKLLIREADPVKHVLKNDSSIAQLDAAKLRFPLTWRRWAPGDVFTPFGMKSDKKISDLLTDAKISLPDKEKITVLESAGTIVWVVGMRIHDSYKVTPDTQKVVIIECK
jgi:tRNA(Ile)-lysidine synthase